MASKHIILNPGTMATDGDALRLAKASQVYGGMTILAANFTNKAATNAGTSFHLVLQNYGTSGTVAGGTIGQAGGTTDPFVANAPKAFTLTAANVYLAPGEWLVLKKVEQNDSDIDAVACIDIEYVDGISLVGR